MMLNENLESSSGIPEITGPYVYKMQTLEKIKVILNNILFISLPLNYCNIAASHKASYLVTAVNLAQWNSKHF